MIKVSYVIFLNILFGILCVLAYLIGHMIGYSNLKGLVWVSIVFYLVLLVFTLSQLPKFVELSDREISTNIWSGAHNLYRISYCEIQSIVMTKLPCQIIIKNSSGQRLIISGQVKHLRALVKNLCIQLKSCDHNVEFDKHFSDYIALKS